MSLSNKKWFSFLNLKRGFQQIKLDKESSDVCTFSTPFGLYKLKRLPFGISYASEEFQRQNLKDFGDIKNVKMYFNVILIATKDEITHIETVREILKRAK